MSTEEAGATNTIRHAFLLMLIRVEEFEEAVALLKESAEELQKLQSLQAEEHPFKAAKWNKCARRRLLVARGAALSLYMFRQSAEVIKGLLAKAPSIARGIVAGSLDTFDDQFDTLFPNWRELRLSADPGTDFTQEIIDARFPPQSGTILGDGITSNTPYNLRWGGPAFLLQVNEISVENLGNSADLFFKAFDKRAGYSIR